VKSKLFLKLLGLFLLLLVFQAAAMEFAFIPFIAGKVLELPPGRASFLLGNEVLFSGLIALAIIGIGPDQKPLGPGGMPDLPGFDDVFGGAFRFLVTVLMSFALAIAFTVLKMFDVMDVPASALIASMVLGCLYFPMAFLAVAMKDTALAVNPLVVIPAILKVRLGYLVTTMVVIGIYALRQFGGDASGIASSTSFRTRDMSMMFMAFGLGAVWSLVSVYLLTVSMRILGLLYVTNKQKFGWFGH